MGTDGLRIEGFLDIEIINKKDKVRRRYHNTITNAGKKYLLAKSAGHVLRMGGELFGNSRGIGVTGKTVSSMQNVKQGHQDWELTNVLLNLSSTELSGLSGSSTAINIWDSDMNLASKLIGFANNNTGTQAGDNKQGEIVDAKGEYTVDGACVAKRWHYPAGVGSGTINAIAMMPADAVKQKFSAGLGIMKSVDVGNRQVSSWVGAYHFLPPGVTGFTGNNEIMLDCGGGHYKLNLSTGEMTLVASGDPFAVIPSRDAYGCADVLVKNGIVTFIDGAGDPQYQLRYFDPVNNTNTVVAYLANAASYKFLEYNGRTYAIAIRPYGSTSTGNNIIYEISFNASGIPSLVNTYTDYSELTGDGFVLPSGLSTEFGYGNIGFSNYGNSYIMWHAIGESQYRNRIAGWIFTDPTDIAGSISGYIGEMDCNSPTLQAGTTLGILNMYRYVAFDDDYLHDDYSDMGVYVKNALATGTPVGTRFTDDYTNYICMDGWSGNVMSFVKLSESISKGDEDEMYVSYGYRVV